MERFPGRLSSYDGHAGIIFPSKTDRIMSRYRRIAPKPTAPCASDADKSASSAMSFDNLCVRQAPTSTATPPVKQKSKRVRKRRSKESDTSEPSKRLAVVGRVPNSAEKEVIHVSTAGAAPLILDEDVGFMKRAAASAPSSVFPLEKARKTLSSNGYGFGGCFTEMIRGIAGLPSAAHVHSLLQQQQQSLQGANFLSALTQEPPKQLVDEVGPPGRAGVSEDYANKEGSSDAVCSSFFWGRSPTENADCCVSEEQQQSGLDEENSDGEDDGRRRAATLNLLPDAPSRKESPSITSCTSLRQISEQGNSACGNSLVDVEQMYGRSSEPVVLVDDLSCTVLWENQGYVKACKDEFRAPATFIDPLGIPTQLRKLQIQLDGQSECVSATLWGFLRKLVVDLGGREASRETPFNADLSFERRKEAERSPACSVQQRSCHGTPSGGNLSAALAMSFDSLVSPGVITPRPVRLVGSVVSLESITEVQTRGVAMVSLESAKQQLEGSSLPGFLTDAAWVVRWVNSAYKAMVGQPECPWLTSTMSMGDEAPTITGEVLLSCNVEVPLAAASFSGRANVQWTRNTGERSCMTVPCDVSSLVDSRSTRRMLMWRLDIQASLSLNWRLQR